MTGDALCKTFAEETNYTLIQVESEKVEKLENGYDRGVGSWSDPLRPQPGRWKRGSNRSSR